MDSKQKSDQTCEDQNKKSHQDNQIDFEKFEKAGLDDFKEGDNSFESRQKYRKRENEIQNMENKQKRSKIQEDFSDFYWQKNDKNRSNSNKSQVNFDMFAGQSSNHSSQTSSVRQKNIFDDFQQTKKPPQNFDEFIRKSDTKIQNADSQRNSGSSEKPEEVNFSLFNSIKSDKSRQSQSSVAQSVENPLESNFQKKDDKQDVNLSMFQSMKSGANSEESKFSEQRVSEKVPEKQIQSSKEIKNVQESKSNIFGSDSGFEKKDSLNKSQVNFDMFAGQSSNHSSQTSSVRQKNIFDDFQQTKKPPQNFDEFIRKSDTKIQNADSQRNSGSSEKPEEVNFSLFNSIKSDKSRQSQSSVAQSVENPLESNFQKKDDKQDVNLSMFQSMKSGANSEESKFSEQRVSEKVPEKQIQSSKEIKNVQESKSNIFGSDSGFEKKDSLNKSQVNFDMFAGQSSNHSSQTSSVRQKNIFDDFQQTKKPPQNFDEFIRKSDTKIQNADSQRNSGSSEKPEEVNFSLFNSIKSDKSRQSQSSVAQSVENPLESNFQKKDDKQDVNLSMFQSMKSGANSEESKFSEQRVSEKVPEKQIQSSKEIKNVQESKSNIFGSDSGFEKKDSLNKSQVNFDMFAGQSSNHSSQTSSVRQKNIFDDFQQTKKPPQNFDEFIRKSDTKIQNADSQRNSGSSEKPEEVNFSLFNSIKSDKSRQSQSSVAQSVENPLESNFQKKDDKQDVNLSMFQSMKSGANSEESKFSEQRVSEKVPEKQIQSSKEIKNVQESKSNIFGSDSGFEKKDSLNKSQVNFDMFAGQSSNHSSQTSSVRQKNIFDDFQQTKKPPQNFDEFIRKSDTKIQNADSQRNSGSSEKPEEVNFSLFNSIKSDKSRQSQSSVAQSVENPLESNFQKKDDKQDVNLSMFQSMKSGANSEESKFSEQRVSEKVPEKQIQSSKEIKNVQESKSNIFGSDSGFEKKDSLNKSQVNFDMFAGQSSNHSSQTSSVRQKIFNLPLAPNLQKLYHGQELPNYLSDSINHRDIQNISHHPFKKPLENVQIVQTDFQLPVYSEQHIQNNYHLNFDNFQSVQDVSCRTSDNKFSKISGSKQIGLSHNPQTTKLKHLDLTQLQNKRASKLKKFNEVIKNVNYQSQSISCLQKRSQQLLQMQNKTLNIFMDQLESIRNQIFNLSNLDSEYRHSLQNQNRSESSCSEYFEENSIASIIQCCQMKKKEEQNRIDQLLLKVQQLADWILVFTEKLNKKKMKIASDPFYGITSPFQVVSQLKENQNWKLFAEPTAKNSDSGNPKILNKAQDSFNFDKFYISGKYEGSFSYKKLFAPSTSIQHKSSFYSISVDYTFENSQARKILRVCLNIKNISNSCLNELKIHTPQIKTCLSIQPQIVTLDFVKPRQTICQMIYLSNFDPENYFIPCEISFITDGGVKKQIHLPISTDIFRFMQKIKPKSNINTEEETGYYQQKGWLDLKRSCALCEYPEGYKKIGRFEIINQTEKLKLEETFKNQGEYSVKVLSRSKFQSSAESVCEYLKFIYG